MNRLTRLTLIAPPGGGKGAQAELLVKELGIVHISTGDLFRAIAKGSYRGNLPVESILSFMEKGLLVPDDIVVNVVRERFEQKDAVNGYLLDGFPRNKNQAMILDSMKERSLDAVIEIRVDDSSLIRRLTGRRTCPLCGKIYNVYLSPPRKNNYCDADGTELTLRKDDNEEIVRQRLDVYNKETFPLIDYYKVKGLLHSVNGEQTVESVFRDIMGVMGS